MSHALAISEPAAPTIEALALRAQHGEAECFDEIARRIQPRLRSFLLTRVGPGDGSGTKDDVVDDLVQETFVKALTNLPRYDSRYRFSTWLFTIASNLAVSHHRAKRYHKRDVDIADGAASSAVAARGPASDPATHLAERQAGARLWQRASEVLKPSQYKALWLRYGEDLTVKEIAGRTGYTAIHVRVLLYRARRRLAQEVA